MDKDSLFISKSNFIEFRKQNIIDFYDFHPKLLGRGAYGTVYKARQKQLNGQWRAIKKILKKTIRNPQSIKNQMQNLTRLDHPSIIKIYQIFQDDKNLFLVTDLFEGGELFDRLQQLGSFCQKDARTIFMQIIQAINYCHRQKIAHRDLKPQNFLFLNKNTMNLKLIDFGLSFKWNQSMREELIEKGDNKLVGTSYYIAPEIIQGSYDERCDIWSAGVILYILVTAIPPFDGQNDREIIASVRRTVYTFDIPQMKKISDECKDLIKKMLMPEKNRISIEQIYKHPWMKAELPSSKLDVNFKKMAEYSKYSNLKKIAATFIASKFSQKQLQKQGSIFKQIDTNHDGYLSIEQLKKALDDQHYSASQQQLKKMINAIDTDKNDMVNYNQFIASCLQSSKMFTKQNLLTVFKTIDKDGNGIIDRKQLTTILQKNNFSPLNGEQVDHILINCDKNKDGMIDFNQFVIAMIN